MIAAATMATAALLCSPFLAAAAEVPNPTAQALEYGMAWIPFIRPEDQPARRYAVCLVDTGVNVTPDTPADDPAGPIVFRGALDGGSGLGANDWEHSHGTRMAMTLTAPANNWGQIGTWPGMPILSVRVLPYDRETLAGGDYRRAIDWCLNPSSNPVAAINLSLGCNCTLTGQQLAELENRIADAHSDGVSVVAAAGNVAGAGVQAPGNVTGAFAVAAGGATGQLCSYASFDGRVGALGPGCEVHVADTLTGEPSFSELGGGSSMATTTVSGVVALLRSYRPQAMWSDVEGWVRQGTRQVGGRPVLDAAAAARAAGLGEIVDRAQAAQTAAASTPRAVPSSGYGSIESDGTVIEPRSEAAELPLPLVRARWRLGVLTVRVRNRPVGAKVKVTALRRGHQEFRSRRVGQRTRAASSVRLRLSRPPDRIQVRYVASPSGLPGSSAVDLQRRRDNSYGP